MSERVLPDNLDQWPRDPYELLGVPRDVGARDLKRAYTALIRQFKPEQKPDEFRQIRQAYDMVTQFLAWGLSAVSAEQSPPDASELHGAGPITDETDTFWRQALDGDPRAAHAGLLQLALRFPQRTDLPLRLYWIQSVFPEVDAGGRASDWLIAAVREHGPHGPAGEVLHRELFDHPAETLSSTAPLLDSDWLPAALVDFAQARWWAAMQLHTWMAIRSDLDLLRPRVAAVDEAAWLRLLCAAIDATVWHANEPEAGALLVSCRDEVRRLEHLAVRDSLLFDRLDYVLAVAPSWGNVRRQFRVPASLAEMIPLSWSAPFARIRPMLARLFGEIVAQPRIWLNWFDEIFMHALSVLDHIGNLFQQYQDRLESPPIDPHTPPQLAALLADFIARLNSRNYPAMRAPILDFCLAESVSAEMATTVIPPIRIQPHGGDLISLRTVIGRDAPLRLVCWAHRLFWA